MSEQENILEQKDKFKWRDNPPRNLSPEKMKTAFECAAKADNLKCDCWHTKCPYFGDCRKCVVFHMCLDQLPTCQRSMWPELEETYLIKSTGSAELNTTPLTYMDAPPPDAPEA